MHEVHERELHARAVTETVPLAVTLTVAHGEPGRIASRETTHRLPGALHLPEHPIGVVLFVTPTDGVSAAGPAELEQRLWQARVATVDIALLEPEAAHFADAVTHLPLLAERLLAVIRHLTRLMESDAIPTLPIGLFAVGDATPVAVRAAAVRDTAIAALVCVGGLVDLAGLQYLRELKAPLLMLVAPDDHTAASNLARARPLIPGRTETHPLACHPLPGAATSDIVEPATTWFRQHLLAAIPQQRRSGS